MITIKTLAEATSQEVFDHIAAHLIKQGQQSWNGGSCLYWQEFTVYRVDGTKEDITLQCAAGSLFTKEEWEEIVYKNDLNDSTWRDIVPLLPKENSHTTLIYDLQMIHDKVRKDIFGISIMDGPEWVAGIVEDLRKYAKVHNLSQEAIDNALKNIV